VLGIKADLGRAFDPIGRSGGGSQPGTPTLIPGVFRQAGFQICPACGEEPKFG